MTQQGPVQIWVTCVTCANSKGKDIIWTQAVDEGHVHGHEAARV